MIKQKAYYNKTYTLLFNYYKYSYFILLKDQIQQTSGLDSNGCQIVLVSE